MIKQLLLGAALAVPLWANAAPPNLKMLTFKYNEHVIINITNQPCPDKDMNKNFTNVAFAARDDGALLPGCFTHEKDMVIIKWKDGDVSSIPADYFLGPQQ